MNITTTLTAANSALTVSGSVLSMVTLLSQPGAPGVSGANVPGNLVVINSLADLPDPVAGVIQLANNTNYLLATNISTSNRVALGLNNRVTANNVFGPTWEYTGTGTMFTGVDKNFQIDNIGLNCPNGQVYDLSSPTSGGNIFFSTGVIITSCDKFGTFNNLNTVDVSQGSAISVGDGITVLGNTQWDIFSMNKIAMFSTSASFIGVDFGTSLHQTLELRDLILRAPAGAIGIKGAASSANLTTGNLSTVNGGEFSGGLTPLSGISIDDIRWNFIDNAGISDSLSDALLAVNGNALETTITTVDTPVKVNAVWTCVRESRFTCTTDGRVTYNAERDGFFPVDGSIRLVSVGGTPIDATPYIAKNGAIIADTGRTVAISGSKPTQVTIPWQLTMAQDDYLEVFVENNTNDNNIIVKSAVIRVR